MFYWADTNQAGVFLIPRSFIGSFWLPAKAESST